MDVEHAVFVESTAKWLGFKKKHNDQEMQLFCGTRTSGCVYDFMTYDDM